MARFRERGIGDLNHLLEVAARIARGGMELRVRIAFFALVVAQAAHSMEEYVFQFYEVFPPAQLLDELLPGFPRLGFIVFNTLLVLFGIWCFLSSVRPGTPSGRDWVWIWVVIELFNGVAHPIWAVSIRGYVPGLSTSPVLLALALYLLHYLRTTPEVVANRVAR